MHVGASEASNGTQYNDFYLFPLSAFKRHILNVTIEQQIEVEMFCDHCISHKAFCTVSSIVTIRFGVGKEETHLAIPTQVIP